MAQYGATGKRSGLGLDYAAQRLTLRLLSIPLTKEQAEKAWAGGARKTLPSEGVGINPTWAYDPAREALAPNWKAYTNLAKAGVRGELKKNYRNGIAATQMSRGEWEAYSRATIERVDDDKKVQVLISTLARPVMDALDFDPKLMGTNHSIHHGGRGRRKETGEKKKSGFNPKRDLTLQGDRGYAATHRQP